MTWTEEQAIGFVKRIQATKTDPELIALIERSVCAFQEMSSDERAKVLRQQRAGYAKAEASWPSTCPYK